MYDKDIHMSKTQLDALLDQLILKQQSLWTQYMALKTQLSQIDEQILKLNGQIIMHTQAGDDDAIN